MLLQLTGPQLANLWPEVRDGLEEVLPPFTYGDPERLNNILHSLQVGAMQCWIMQKGEKPFGFVVTTFDDDENSGVKNLVIYALWSLSKIPHDIWIDGLRVLREFAKKYHCHRITALSSVPRIWELSEMLGGDTSYRFIFFEVE